MKTVEYPYEILVRFDTQGNVTGAHVTKLHHYLTDADEFLFERPGVAEPLSIENFPQSDIMSQVQVTALATTQRHIARVAELERLLQEAEDRASVNAQRAKDLQQAVDRAVVIIDQLELQVASATAAAAASAEAATAPATESPPAEEPA